MKRLLAGAFVVATALGLVALSAQAQPNGAPEVNAAALSDLPADVQGELAAALQRGNSERIENAINSAIFLHPELAAAIAGQAAAAFPAGAGIIAGAAIAAALRENASPAMLRAIASAITQANPGDAPAIVHSAVTVAVRLNATPAQVQAISGGVTSSAPATLAPEIAGSAVAAAVAANASPNTVQAITNGVATATPAVEAPQIAHAATMAVVDNNGPGADVLAVASGAAAAQPTQATGIAQQTLSALPLAQRTAQNINAIVDAVNTAAGNQGTVTGAITPAGLAINPNTNPQVTPPSAVQSSPT